MNASKIKYPEDWDTRLYDSHITLALTPPSEGWIDLILTGSPRGDLTEIHFTYVYDPLPDFVKWVSTLGGGGYLLSSTTVDEEGIEVFFSVESIADRPDWMELHVGRSGEIEDADDDTPPRTIYHSRVKRRQFIHEFYRRFEQWCREDYIPEQWHRFSCMEEDEDDRCVDPRTLDLAPLLAAAGK